MKRLKGLDKLMYFINSIVAMMLLLAYLLPYVPPNDFAVISILSLTVPLLMLVNICFVIYWLLKVKRQLFLSLLILLLGYKYLFSLYKFSSSKNVEDQENILVMNYNVRLFNVYEWIKDKNVQKSMSEFIAQEHPDIISMQEYRPDRFVNLEGYYKYEKLSGQKLRNGQAIFSKFPIVNSGSIEFPNTFNNAIFVDVVKGVDTIRIYNVHLQSLRIEPTAEALSKETSEHLIKRISSAFKKQQSQAELFLKHKSNCPYKMVICGDFNNTTYSYVYKEIKGDLQDSFEAAGNGFGKTFNFKFFPIRIDFILADKAFEINGYKTYDDIELSDHYPIMAKMKLN